MQCVLITLIVVVGVLIFIIVGFFVSLTVSYVSEFLYHEREMLKMALQKREDNAEPIKTENPDTDQTVSDDQNIGAQRKGGD